MKRYNYNLARLLYDLERVRKKISPDLLKINLIDQWRRIHPYHCASESLKVTDLLTRLMCVAMRSKGCAIHESI